MTAPTLPAMSEDELIELWQASDPHGPSANERFACAIIAARDAQWAARLDAAVRDERDAVMAPLFNGWAVLQHLDERAAKRTSHQNVSDTLDAAVRAIRARTKD